MGYRRALPPARRPLGHAVLLGVTECRRPRVELGQPGPSTTWTPLGGRPDGLCIDSEGCLWVAIWLGSEVRRYAPDGRLLQRVQVPTAMAIGCASADLGLGVLCITPASGFLAKAERAAAARGCGVRLHGVPGLPAAEFLG
jgi:sugar lactone lactonase YvrE